MSWQWFHANDCRKHWVHLFYHYCMKPLETYACQMCSLMFIVFLKLQVCMLPETSTKGSLFWKTKCLLGLNTLPTRFSLFLLLVFMLIFFLLLRWLSFNFFLTLQIDCFVCSSCFRFIGSVELQIGRRLYLQELGASESHGCDMNGFSNTSKYNYEIDSSDGEDNSYMKRESTGECTSGSSQAKIHLPEGVVQSLMNGHMRLPYSEEFSLPPAVPCPGRCGEAYYCR